MKALLTLAAALAALVVAVPNALAADQPQAFTIITDTLGGNGGQPASTLGVLDAVKRSSPNQVGLAWQYLRDTGQIAAASAPPRPRPRPDDRAGVRGPGPTVATLPGNSAFDWADWGIGAGSGIALTLLVLGGIAIVVRRPTDGAPAPAASAVS